MKDLCNDEHALLDSFHLWPSHLVTLEIELKSISNKVLRFLDIIWLSVLLDSLVSPLGG